MAQAPRKGQNSNDEIDPNKGKQIISQITSKDALFIDPTTGEAIHEITIFAPQDTDIQLIFGNEDMAVFPAKDYLQQNFATSPTIQETTRTAIGLTMMANADNSFNDLPDCFPAVLKKQIKKKQMQLRIGSGPPVLFTKIFSKRIVTFVDFSNKLWCMTVTGKRRNGKKAVGGIYYFFDNVYQYNDENQLRLEPSEIAIFIKERYEEQEDNNFNSLYDIVSKLGFGELFDNTTGKSLKFMIDNMSPKEKVELYMKLAEVDSFKNAFMDLLCDTVGGDTSLVFQVAEEKEKEKDKEKNKLSTKPAPKS